VQALFPVWWMNGAVNSYEFQPFRHGQANVKGWATKLDHDEKD
jgi:hypothetical protein